MTWPIVTGVQKVAQICGTFFPPLTFALVSTNLVSFSVLNSDLFDGDMYFVLIILEHWKNKENDSFTQTSWPKNCHELLSVFICRGFNQQRWKCSCQS